MALRDARGRSVARGGWDVACASTSPTEVIDRGDGVYVVRARAAPPEVALTVTVGGRPVGAARWRATVVADERPIKIYVKSDGRRMESHAQAYGVKRYGDTVRALKDRIAAKTGVAPARQRLWMWESTFVLWGDGRGGPAGLLWDDAATLAACGVKAGQTLHLEVLEAPPPTPPPAPPRFVEAAPALRHAPAPAPVAPPVAAPAPAPAAAPPRGPRARARARRPSRRRSPSPRRRPLRRARRPPRRRGGVVVDLGAAGPLSAAERDALDALLARYEAT